MITAITKNIPDKINHIANKGKTNFNHFTNGILAIARTAISVPEVGMIWFENPSPHVKANTAVCLVIPSRSESGAIKGIVTAACPDPDGIKKFKVV